jgi:hypothetical protein
MKKIKIVIYLLLCHFIVGAQDLLRVNINVKENTKTPVSIPLDAINYNTDKFSLSLYEIINNGEKQIPCQLETGYTPKLWFFLVNEMNEKITKEFVIRLEKKKAKNKTAISTEKTFTDLVLKQNNKTILNYRYGLTYPPDSVIPIFDKNKANLIKYGAYLHPVFSPGGEVLTQIKPPDHPHHYGIWGSWTKTKIGNRELNFWDLSLGQGSVRFASILSLFDGDIYGGFKVLQEHIDYGANGKDQVALNEVLEVRAWNIDEKVYMIDYISTLTTVVDSGLTFEQYRYGGGIGFRATEKWNAQTSTILTSELKTRADADNTTARWCIVEGISETDEGRSGIIFMSHPSNRSHPEPMRIWPEASNKLYFQFSPIKFESWKLEQNQPQTLKYRLLIFDGKISASEAEKYWQDFANNSVIEIK